MTHDHSGRTPPKTNETIPSLGQLLDRRQFDAAHGSLRGEMAVLQEDGLCPILLADAAFLAAIWKARESMDAVGWLAWMENQRDFLAQTITNAAALAVRLGEEKAKRQLH